MKNRLSLAALLCLTLAACQTIPQDNFDPSQPSKWKYGTKYDEMRKVNVSFAEVKTDTPLDLPKGPVFVELTLLHGDKNNNEGVLLTAEGGNLYCPFSKCKVTASFAGSRPFHFNATSTHDGSTENIEINGPQAAFFANSVLQSSSVIVEATFYKAGSRQVTFDTKNINWPGYPIDEPFYPN